MQHTLSEQIQANFSISTADVEKITHFFKPQGLSRHEFFLKERQYAQQMAFIQSGLLREFFHHDGKEVSKWVSGNGYFTTDLSSFLFAQPARVNIQALTDCELYCISRTDYARMAHIFPKWPEIEKTFLARCFTVLESRVMSHLSLSAEERYDAFFSYNPALFNQVPSQYLASMLGMTPETFSRIRKKRSQSNS